MSHPLRRDIYAILSERVACPRELGAELGITVDSASYHCKRLVALECAELVREEKAAGSGAVSHHYRATSRDSVIKEEWRDMDPVVGESFLTEIVERKLADFTRSVDAGMIGRDDQFMLARTLHSFDALGLDEALAIQEEARLKLIEVQERSVARVTAEGGESTMFSTWQACFEVPPSSPR